ATKRTAEKKKNMRVWSLASAASTAAAAAAAAALILAAPTPTSAATTLARPTPQAVKDTSSTTTPSNNNIDDNYPPLDLVHSILRTTAAQDFAGAAGLHHSAYAAAYDWQRQRLLADNVDSTAIAATVAPYLACAEYGHALHSRANLEKEFDGGPASVHTVSHSAAHGACFVVSVSPPAAEHMLENPSRLGLTSAGPFLSALKIAPGVLDHGEGSAVDDDSLEKTGAENCALVTKHGRTMTLDGVRGLSVKLSPGTVTRRQQDAREIARNWHSELMSRSLNMHQSSYWSDPDMLDGEGGHLSRTAGRVRAHEWTRAADVVHGLAAEGNNSVGEVCSFGGARLHLVDDNILTVSG
ncbi:unnamed protein product, partial [Sphacelaria rigidula]